MLDDPVILTYLLLLLLVRWGVENIEEKSWRLERELKN